jgi:hypothetical protein
MARVGGGALGRWGWGWGVGGAVPIDQVAAVLIRHVLGCLIVCHGLARTLSHRSTLHHDAAARGHGGYAKDHATCSQ